MSETLQPDHISHPSDSSDTIALILETVFGFFGFLGMGWLYAGNIPVAVSAFLGFMIVVLIEFILIAVTIGLAACFTMPFNLVVAIISGLRVRDHVRSNGVRGSFKNIIAGLFVIVGILCISFFAFGILFRNI